MYYTVSVNKDVAFCHWETEHAVAAVLKPFQLGFNLPVALGNLGLIHPVQLQGLGQLEDMFLPPVALATVAVYVYYSLWS